MVGTAEEFHGELFVDGHAPNFRHSEGPEKEAPAP
jgi:hypothetical protein